MVAVYPDLLIITYICYSIFGITTFSVYDYYAIKLRHEMTALSKVLSTPDDTAAVKSRDLLSRFTTTGLVGSIGIVLTVVMFACVIIFDMEGDPWLFLYSEIFFKFIELFYQSLIMYLFHPLFNGAMPRSTFFGLLLHPQKVHDAERERRRIEATNASTKEAKDRSSSACKSAEDHVVLEELPEEASSPAPSTSGSGALPRSSSSRRSSSRSSSTRRKNKP